MGSWRQRAQEPKRQRAQDPRAPGAQENNNLELIMYWLLLQLELIRQLAPESPGAQASASPGAQRAPGAEENNNLELIMYWFVLQLELNGRLEPESQRIPGSPEIANWN